VTSELQERAAVKQQCVQMRDQRGATALAKVPHR
jgi:hypothetical protein